MNRHYEGTLRQQPAPPKEEFNMRQIDTNYSMIYYGEFLTKGQEEGALVKILYENKDPAFFALLANYKVPADYDQLKQSIYDLLPTMPEYSQYVKLVPVQPKKATYPPLTILDALDHLE